jgi:chloramphenicol-sensitive protein RarD
VTATTAPTSAPDPVTGPVNGSRPGSPLRRELPAAGLLFGIGAYGIWGVFPLYFRRLAAVGPWETAAYRILATSALCWLMLRARRDTAWTRSLRRPRTLAMLVASGSMITVNWLVYIWAVRSGHVVDAAIGYFVNPLVTVALGVIVLRERLRRLQVWALGFGALAVVVLTVAYGRLPWVAIVLAGSFGTYSYLKKTVGLATMQSLAAETLAMAPVAVVLLAVLQLRPGGLDAARAPGPTLGWLSVIGVVTAVPLLCFGAAATRIPLAQLGLLQYLTPVLQLLCGVLAFHEHVPAERWMGMGIVWIALGLLAADALRAGSQQAGAQPVGDQPVGAQPVGDQQMEDQPVGTPRGPSGRDR